MNFARLLSEALAAPELPKTGDLLAVGLPLLRQIDDLHHRGLVGLHGGLDAVAYDGVRLALTTPEGRGPHTNTGIEQLNPLHPPQAISISARFDQDLATRVTASFRAATSSTPSMQPVTLRRGRCS